MLAPVMNIVKDTFRRRQKFACFTCRESWVNVTDVRSMHESRLAVPFKHLLPWCPFNYDCTK